MKTVSLFFPRLITISLFLLLAASLTSKAQDSLLKTTQFKAGLKLAGLGASFEKRLMKSVTFYSEASINFVTGTSLTASYAYVDPGKSQYDYFDGFGYVKVMMEERKTNGWVPVVSTEVRHYYNIDKRTRLNKVTRNNSFNFLGIGASYLLGAKTNLDGINYDPGLAAYGAWGMQKSVGKMFSFEFNLNPGIAFALVKDPGSPDFYLGGNIKFDFVIK